WNELANIVGNVPLHQRYSILESVVKGAQPGYGLEALMTGLDNAEKGILIKRALTIAVDNKVPYSVSEILCFAPKMDGDELNSMLKPLLSDNTRLNAEIAMQLFSYYLLTDDKISILPYLAASQLITS